MLTEDPGRTAALALLLEATSGPKPGNVDRDHDHDDATLHHFVASAHAVGPPLGRAAEAATIGAAIEEATAAAGGHGGGNTHFGAILLLAPLVAAAGADDLLGGARRAVAGTTPDDAARFFAAFDHVDVALPPVEELDGSADIEGLDARDPATRDRVRAEDVTLEEVMRRSADVDGVAREWTRGFPRTVAAADRLDRHFDADRVDASERAVVATTLDLLAEEPDTFVAKRHGEDVAREVVDRAAAVRDGEERLEVLDAALVERGINPGTTADIVAGGLFVALRRDGGFRV